MTKIGIIGAVSLAILLIWFWVLCKKLDNSENKCYLLKQRNIVLEREKRNKVDIVYKNVPVPVEKIVYKDKIIYKDRPVPTEKIVYRDRPVEVEKIVYKFISLEEKINMLFKRTTIYCDGSKALIRTPSSGRGYQIIDVPKYPITKYYNNAYNKGVIYIAYSKFTDAIKIGYTARPIKERITELNGVSTDTRRRWHSTGAGTTMDWKYVYLITANKDREDEAVHEYIKFNKPTAYSLQQGEMFKLTPEEGLKIVLEYFAVNSGGI